MHFVSHDKTEECAKVFIQDAAEQTSGGMTRAELLLTVLEGDVREADVINVPMRNGKPMPREVEGLVHKCASCTFGATMQEGDRGAVVVPGLELAKVELGKLATVVRERIE